MIDIIGVGDTNIDLIVEVDHIPSHDEKIRGKLLGKFPGGIIGNFCSAAAKFGAETGIVTKLGNDDFGNLCKNDFIKRGIELSGLIQRDDVDTYFCVVHLDNTGEKALTIVETSGFLPVQEEIDIDYLKTAKYVHMTTLDVELANYIFNKLNQFNCKLSLDIEDTASEVKDYIWLNLLKKLDVAFPNIAGLRKLTGTSDIDTGAKYLLDAGVKMVVVTCGVDGVKIFKDNYHYELPAYKVDVKDTTGAGDCFNAVFLACLCKGFTIEDSAKYATAAAAIAIQSVGAREGLPSLRDVELFLMKMGEKLCN